MARIASGPPDARRRRRLTTDLKDTLRELSIQLALLNRQVSAQAELRDVDFDCLELINREGPLSPSALARRAGLHAATLTGVLDRLERAGWVRRDRDPQDRRAVVLRARRERAGELIRHYAGMNGALDRLCAGYSEAQLELLAGFLRRTATAGQQAAAELAGD